MNSNVMVIQALKNRKTIIFVPMSGRQFRKKNNGLVWFDFSTKNADAIIKSTHIKLNYEAPDIKIDITLFV